MHNTRRSVFRAVQIFLALAAATVASTGQTNTDPAEACVQAMRQAATETGVPLDALQEISRVSASEGAPKQMQVWPWTVNLEGHGVWFDTENEALAYVFDHFRQGARQFDVGCFQLNYDWHARAFHTIEDMFDPLLNARQAAAHLSKLRNTHGTWPKAVRAYLDRTHGYDRVDISRYATIRTHLPLITAVAPATDVERFPLFFGQTNLPLENGNLVVSQRSAGSLFDRRQVQ